MGAALPAPASLARYPGLATHSRQSGRAGGCTGETAAIKQRGAAVNVSSVSSSCSGWFYAYLIDVLLSHALVGQKRGEGFGDDKAPTYLGCRRIREPDPRLASAGAPVMKKGKAPKPDLALVPPPPAASRSPFPGRAEGEGWGQSRCGEGGRWFQCLERAAPADAVPEQPWASQTPPLEVHVHHGDRTKAKQKEMARKFRQESTPPHCSSLISKLLPLPPPPLLLRLPASLSGVLSPGGPPAFAGHGQLPLWHRPGEEGGGRRVCRAQKGLCGSQAGPPRSPLRTGAASPHAIKGLSPALRKTQPTSQGPLWLGFPTAAGVGGGRGLKPKQPHNMCWLAIQGCPHSKHTWGAFHTAGALLSPPLLSAVNLGRR